jgi:Phage tail assembly chaperone proteins, E, or 41 or 14
MSDTTLPPPTLTIELAPPIEHDGGRYEALVLREPTTGDVLLGDMQLRNGTTHENLRQRQIHIIHRVAGVPVPLVQKLPISKFNQAWVYVSAFLDAGPPTGET